MIDLPGKKFKGFLELMRVVHPPNKEVNGKVIPPYTIRILKFGKKSPSGSVLHQSRACSTAERFRPSFQNHHLNLLFAELT